MASVNLVMNVGLWIPKSVPYTAVSDSLSSARVGSVAGPSCCSVVTTPTVRPSAMTFSPWTPVASWRMPVGVSSVTSTSAIRWLRVASHPTNSMPAALRMTLRPPSAPTR